MKWNMQKGSDSSKCWSYDRPDFRERYRSAQIKAAVKVNAEQLLFNWQLGRDLVTRKAEEQWGTGVVEQLPSIEELKARIRLLEEELLGGVRG